MNGEPPQSYQSQPNNVKKRTMSETDEDDMTLDDTDSEPPQEAAVDAAFDEAAGETAEAVEAEDGGNEADTAVEAAFAEAFDEADVPAEADDTPEATDTIEAESAVGETDEAGIGGDAPSATEARMTSALSRALGGDVPADGGGDAAGLRDRLNHRLAAFELRRQQNLEAVAAAAHAATGETGTGAAGGDIDDDWMVRFVLHAQDVTNEDMQQAWGYVLAREAADPGTFGLPALDCLSAMTADDVALLMRLGRIAFPTGLLLKLTGRDAFEAFGVDAADLERLRGLGLVQESEDLGITFHAPTRGLTLDYRGADLVVRNPETEFFTFPAYKLSAVGRELLGALADEPTDVEYLKALAADLETRGFAYRLRTSAGEDIP